MATPETISRLRHWALLTACLYGLALCALTLPLIGACFWFPQGLGSPENLLELAEDVTELTDVYKCWPYWLGIGVLSLLEGLVLLLAPVAQARKRPVTRKKWTLLACVSGFLMGLLVGAGVITVTEGIFLDTFIDRGEPVELLWASLILGLMGWAFWTFLFWRFSRTCDERSVLRKIMNRLLAGSVVELLIAVPTHVYVRNKDYCCGGFGTFVGIATGLAVMLFAFGPGVFFLFVERMQRVGKVKNEKRGQREQRNQRKILAGPMAALQNHGRDAFMWALVAVAFLMMPVLHEALQGEPATPFTRLCRISFLVMGATAGLHAVGACRCRERIWGLPLLGAAFLGGLAMLMACVWVSN